jgi:hypothetical protein
MKLNIEIEMDNEAFADSTGFEAARILRRLSARIADLALEVGDAFTLMDANGNKVGVADVTEDA